MSPGCHEFTRLTGRFLKPCSNDQNSDFVGPSSNQGRNCYVALNASSARTQVLLKAS